MCNYCIILDMKLPATLHFVTQTNERTEWNAHGTAEQTENNVLLRFALPDCELTVTVGDDTVIVARSGENAYVLTLREGHAHIAEIGGLQLPVRTTALRIKKDACRLLFSASYTLGGTDCRVFAKATYTA